jgi:DNA-directed RNA polymerase specialized sigma24 family protein
MRVALWLVGNRPDAEDLLQRTFLQAIEARASFELGRPVLPWLLGLLGNQARKLRSERQRATVVSAPADRVVDAVAEARGERTRTRGGRGARPARGPRTAKCCDCISKKA